MVAGSGQSSPAFKPVDAQATFRRQRVAQIRAEETTTVEGTTVRNRKPMGRGFQVSSQWKAGDAVRRDTYEAVNRQPDDRFAGSPQDWQSMGSGFQGSRSPATNDPVRKADYEAANRKPADRYAGDVNNWKPLEPGFQGSSPWKEGDAVRKEDYDAADRIKQGLPPLSDNPNDRKPLGGESFQGSPIPMGRGFQVSSQWKAGDAVRRDTYEAVNRQPDDRFAGSPQDWQSMGSGFQGSRSPATNDPVRKADYEAANRKPADRYAGDVNNWKPLEPGFQGSSPWKEGDAVRKEDYDAADRIKQGLPPLSDNPNDRKPLGGESFQGSPMWKTGDAVRGEDYRAAQRGNARAEAAESALDPAARERARMQRERIKQGVGAPVQLPPAPAVSPEEDPAARESADRYANNRVDSGAQNYMAQRARQKAALAAKAKNNAAAKGAEDVLAERGAQGIYSLVFNIGGLADEAAPIDGGLSAIASVSNVLWKLALTIFPTFNDTMRENFIGRWLPQKYDLKDEAGLGMLYQGAQWGDFIWGLTIAGLLGVVFVLIFFFLAMLWVLVTNPGVAFPSLLSSFPGGT